jgi:Ca-activated chloride channel family protein
MRFASPWVLILIPLIVPAFLFLRSRGSAIHFSSLSSLKYLKGLTELGRMTARWKLWLPLVLRAAVLILVIVALARPQEGRKETEVESTGVDIILTLDTSGSMQAMDFTINGKSATRLDAVKDVAASSIEKRAGDRVGMVVFGNEAFTQAPLTLDHALLVKLLNGLEIGMAGDSTAIGQALAVSVERIKDIKAKSKLIILLTDGRNNAGQIAPDKAAEIAKAFGVKVYTIGVGTNGPAPFVINTPFGKRMVQERVDLDEGTLKSIADITDARYFRATDTNELAKIYGEIDKLEKTEVKVKEYMEYEERFFWFLLAALLLFLLEIVLVRTRLKKLP